MDLKERFYPETRFGGFTRVDGTVAFYARVNALLKPQDVVLDVRCGRGAFQDDPIEWRRSLRTLRGKCSRVIGIDVDPTGQGNTSLDEFRLLDGIQWPIESGSIDLGLADSVLEHVPNPSVFFAEAYRVLRPGGHFCMRTPNLQSYFGLASKLVPNQFHPRLVKQVGNQREELDVFPTLYRCNTPSKLRRCLKDTGFDACVYGHEAEPAYLSFSSITFRLGVWHQRVSPNCIKPVLFTFAQKHSTRGID